MFHSISIKNTHQSKTVLSINDEEQVRETISSLLDKIDKETNLSSNSPVLLFNVSTNISHRTSPESQFLSEENLFQSSDDYKHSMGILVDEKDISSRKSHLTFLFSILIIILK